MSTEKLNMLNVLIPARVWKLLLVQGENMCLRIPPKSVFQNVPSESMLRKELCMMHTCCKHIEWAKFSE